MKVKVLFDYPTVEGMIYSGSVAICEQEDFDSKEYSEKVQGRLDTGKIIWIPKKLLRKV